MSTRLVIEENALNWALAHTIERSTRRERFSKWH
jgi:hypothetical protein